MPALVACLMALPSAAGAAISVPVPAAERVAAVETAVAETVPAVREAPDGVAQAVQPPSGEVSRPDGQPDAHPVGDAIAIAGAAAAPVAPVTAAAVPQRALEEHGRPRTSHIAATSSGDRTSSGRPAQGRGPDGATRQPSSGRGAPAHRVTHTAATAPTAAPGTAFAVAEPAVPGPAPAGSAPGAAAGTSGGLFFGGGGFALLVASLLLAGPRLRRQLSELPVVCRPAAFHVVLERPG